MRLTNRLFQTWTTLSEKKAQRLRNTGVDWYTVQVQPPKNTDIPVTLEKTVRGILELQSKWFGLKNLSPVTAFEIRRPLPDQLRFQYSVPSKRLERKLRTQLQNEVPEIRFKDGENGLPVSKDDTVGGGALIPGRKDCYPFRTDFDEPPVNSLAATLHRHAMQDTQFIIQVLFKPVVGHPLKHWWWTRNTYQRIGYLRKEKTGKLPWHDRPATPREKRQADTIEHKAGTSKFHTSIRLLVIGAGKHTPSRIKEISGGFNIFENPDTGQYLDTFTVKNLRSSKITEYAETVAQRQLDGTPTFRTSIPELAALVSLPNRQQENIHRQT